VRLEIVTIGEPVLRKRAAEVCADELRSESFQAFLDDLVETMRDANGAGLAAPQVGVSKRVYAVEVRDNPRYPYKPNMPLRVLVNPKVRVLTGETFAVIEGCLSIPGLRGELNRHAEIEIEYTTPGGQRVVEEVHGLSAGTFQHEQDHLDGVLFVDRAEPRSLMTWDAYRTHHEAAFTVRARAIVDRWGG
jgi:peptide deformylase